MGSRAYKYICTSCCRSRTNQPGYTICQRCLEDDKVIAKLGDLIRFKIPQQDLMPNCVILCQLWAGYLARCHPKDTNALKRAKALLAQARQGEQLQLLR